MVAKLHAASISFTRGSVIGTAFFLVVVSAATLLYALIWNVSVGETLFIAFDFAWLGLAMIIAGIIVHELLHGVGFACFGKVACVTCTSASVGNAAVPTQAVVHP